MNMQLTLQNKLFERFTQLKFKNPSYSLRAFSKKMGMNSGVLCSIMNGKRQIGTKLALKIVEKLALDPQERSEVLAFIPNHIVSFDKKEEQYIQLSADQFKVISQWYHFAILSLIKTKDFRNDATWIASRLGVSNQTVDMALERLLRLGLIRIDKNKKIKRGAQKYRTTDDIVNTSLQKGHAENLELAKTSLEQDPITKRDFTAITMAIHPKKMVQAKEKIRKFQDEIAELLEQGEKTEVYKLCVQLFPLTKGGK